MCPTHHLLPLLSLFVFTRFPQLVALVSVDCSCQNSGHLTGRLLQRPVIDRAVNPDFKSKLRGIQSALAKLIFHSSLLTALSFQTLWDAGHLNEIFLVYSEERALAGRLALMPIN